MPSKIIILDGGMSRELMRINAPFQQPEWSAYALLHDGAHYVQQIHTEFIAAGAQVVTTDSYALVPFHIGEERFWSRGKELAGLSGRIAQAAVKDAAAAAAAIATSSTISTAQRVQIAGSLPPIFGSYRPDLFDASKVQPYLQVLVEGLKPYVDVWLGETLSLIAEANAVLEAVKQTGKPIWVAFTLDDSKFLNAAIGSGESYDLITEADPKAHDQARLRSGETVSEAVRWAISHSDMIQAILFNCSRPEAMKQAVQEAKTVVDDKNAQDKIRIGVYANAFVENSEEYAANENVSSTRDDLDREKYVQFTRSWVESGASIVGGCCGIGCEHIKQLAIEFNERA